MFFDTVFLLSPDFLIILYVNIEGQIDSILQLVFCLISSALSRLFIYACIYLLPILNALTSEVIPVTGSYFECNLRMRIANTL